MDSHTVYRGDSYEQWQTVSRSLEDLDAALFSHLSDLCPRARAGLFPVDFERHATPSSVIFTLKHPSLGGELGKIELRRRADNLTALRTLKEPKPERQEPTPAEKAYLLKGVEDNVSAAIDKVYMRVRERERKLRARLGRYFDIIVRQLFQKQCHNDPILSEALGAPPTDEPEVPRWFPKTEKTRQEWQKAYDVIKQTRKEYRQDYDNWNADDSKVTNEDLQDALAAAGAWNGKPSLSTLSRIKKAGDELGLLK